MQNIIQVLADTLLIDLIQKNQRGEKINKKEFDFMMESYKKDHEENLKNNKQLEDEQIEILTKIYNKTADNIKEYCLEYLRIEGRLEEEVTKNN